MKQNNIVASLSAASLKDNNVRNTILKHRRNFKTFIVSVTVVVCFTVSALPVQLWWTLFMVGKIKKSPFQSNWMWMFFIYLIGTSALNPLIYGVIDNNFLTILKKWKRNISKSRRIMNIENSIQLVTNLSSPWLHTVSQTHKDKDAMLPFRCSGRFKIKIIKWLNGSKPNIYSHTLSS